MPRHATERRRQDGRFGGKRLANCCKIALVRRHPSRQLDLLLMSPAFSILAGLSASLGAFLLVVDLAEHQQAARLAVELLMFVPALLLLLRRHREVED